LKFEIFIQIKIFKHLVIKNWLKIENFKLKIIMSCILSIDTSDSTKTVVRLERGDQVWEKKEDRDKAASQIVLALIDQMIKEAELPLSALTAINVNPGPGSFTGLRVGITVAQTLGWILDIPVNGEKGTSIEPIYENSRW